MDVGNDDDQPYRYCVIRDLVYRYDLCIRMIYMYTKRIERNRAVADRASGGRHKPTESPLDLPSSSSSSVRIGRPTPTGMCLGTKTTRVRYYKPRWTIQPTTPIVTLFGVAQEDIGEWTPLPTILATTGLSPWSPLLLVRDQTNVPQNQVALY